MTLLEAIREALTLSRAYAHTHFVVRVREGYAAPAYNDDGLPVAFKADPEGNLWRYGLYVRKCAMGNYARLIG